MPRRVLFLLSLLFITLLSGCSRHDGGVTTIRYMSWGNPEQLAIEQELIARFEKLHPNIRVKLFMVPGSSYHQKLQIMLASHTAPDVMRVDNYYFPALVRKDYFLCLEDLIKGDPGFDLKDFFPQAVRECLYRGKPYAVNVMFGGNVVYYNKTMFKKAGVPEPMELYRQGRWTYDTYLEVCRKLTKKDKSGRYVQFGTLMPPDWPVVWAFGGEFISKDFKTCELDSPQAIRALQFMKDLRWKYHVTPVPAESAMSAFKFESGKVGMIFDWCGVTPKLKKQVHDFDWDIAPLPAGPAGRFTPLKGNQVSIYSESRCPKESWLFMKYLVSPEVEMFLHGKLRRALPSRIKVACDPEYLKPDPPPQNTWAFPDCVKIGKAIPINEKYQSWIVELRSGQELMWINECDAREAVKRIVPKVNRALREEEW